MNDARNFSFSGEPIEFALSCPFVVLIDPIALDGLNAELQAISYSPLAERPKLIRLLPGFMRVGVEPIDRFHPGIYRLGNEDLEETDDQEAAGTFDIDTGTVCVVDLNYLGPTAKTLTWQRYDNFLRSPTGDNSLWVEMTQEIGGFFFGMLSGDISTPFRGDGRYKLRSGAPHPVR